MHDCIVLKIIFLSFFKYLTKVNTFNDKLFFSQEKVGQSLVTIIKKRKGNYNQSNKKVEARRKKNKKTIYKARIGKNIEKGQELWKDTTDPKPHRKRREQNEIMKYSPNKTDPLSQKRKRL